MIDSETSVSVALFQRMPEYLKALRGMRASGVSTVSSATLAKVVKLNPSVIKKDLSYASVETGKPRIGYSIDGLISGIEDFLGYNDPKDAIIVGVGKLGQALMGYKGFAEYGLNILAGFDVNPAIIGKVINGKNVLPLTALSAEIGKMKIKIAVLATPQDHAQQITDDLISAGIRAIWNFTPAHIAVPDTVALKNENMAASLAVLSNQLQEILRKENEL